MGKSEFLATRAGQATTGRHGSQGTAAPEPLTAGDVAMYRRALQSFLDVAHHCAVLADIENGRERFRFRTPTNVIRTQCAVSIEQIYRLVNDAPDSQHAQVVADALALRAECHAALFPNG